MLGRRLGGSAWSDYLILVLVAAVMFAWRLGSHDLWPPDEPRFGLVALEMWESGDYSVLSRNDRLYTDKPPLFFWAINGFAWLLGGVNEWSARLPSAVSGFLSLLLTYRLGIWLYDRRTGLFGALVFASSLQILERARWASIDMTLNFFVLAAILLLWRGVDRMETGASAVRAAWICMGLATLAKGPVGLILPLLAVVPALLLEREFRAARFVFRPTGVLLFLIVTLSWFALFSHRLGTSGALQILTHQTVDRYVDAWNARHPVWYYLWRFPAGFFPWFLFLPWGIGQAFSGEEGRGRRRAAVFLTSWAAAILIFFSFSTGKRGVYIIPIYPAVALLVGRLFTRAAEGEGVPRHAARRRLRTPLLLWSAVGVVLVAALPLLVRDRHPDLTIVAAAMGSTLALGALAGLALHLRKRSAAALGCIVGSIGILVLLGTESFFPWVDRHQNFGGFAEQLKAHLRPDIPFAATEGKRELWVFYTGRSAEEVDTKDAVLEYLGREPPRDLVIEERVFHEVRDELPPGVVELLRGKVAGEEYYLLRREANG